MNSLQIQSFIPPALERVFTIRERTITIKGNPSNGGYLGVKCRLNLKASRSQMLRTKTEQIGHLQPSSTTMLRTIGELPCCKLRKTAYSSLCADRGPACLCHLLPLRTLG
jgi:hypothetical protein